MVWEDRDVYEFMLLLDLVYVYIYVVCVVFMGLAFLDYFTGLCGFIVREDGYNLEDLF